MKKFVHVLVVFILATMFVACQNNGIGETTAITHEKNGIAEPSVYFVAKVVSSGEKSILVEVTDAGNSNISLGSEAWISSRIEQNIDYSSYAADDYVRVVFDGAVMESYPLQINTVTYISLTDSTGKSISDVAPEKKVINIVDKTVNSDICTADALEGFYHDDMYAYYFSSIKSQYVIVEYSDRSTETVKKAINEGRITIADLDFYGIGYYKEPKNIQNIVYHSERGGESDAEEVFYTDEEFAYVFPSIRSDVVIVYYTDGTSQPIKEALKEGKLQIEDLVHFGIEHYSRPVGKYILVNDLRKD